MGLLFESFYLDLLFILLAILTYFKYSFTYWPRRGVPCNSPRFPFGNIKDVILQRQSFGECIQSFYTEFKSKNHRFGGYYVFSNPELFIIDPELIKYILCNDFSYFCARTFRANEEQEPLTGHLLALPEHKWRNMRNKLTPAFSSAKMKMMFQILLTCADGLEGIMNDYVRNKDDIDIKEVFGRFTTDIIGSCAFGLDCNSIQNGDTEFRQFGKKFFITTKFSVFKHILSRTLPKLFYFFNMRQIDEDVSDFYMKVIVDTIDYREKNNVKRNDFLQLLINLKNTGDVDANAKDSANGENRLTLEEIAAQCFLFFIAGFESSSSTMSMFLYNMALDQDIQDKVRKEVTDMLGKYDGKLTYEGILELKYMEQTILETMRLHSAFPVVQRSCTKDYKIPGSDVIVKSGTTITIPLSSLHYDPEYYPDPTKFDPDRFSKKEQAKRHPFTFLPFGEGPKNCIGQRFALMEIKVGLVVLLKNHRFTLSKKTQVPLKIDPQTVFISRFDDIWMNAERI